jgi:hypothetical protein
VDLETGMGLQPAGTVFTHGDCVAVTSSVPAGAPSLLDTRHMHDPSPVGGGGPEVPLYGLGRVRQSKQHGERERPLRMTWVASFVPLGMVRQYVQRRHPVTQDEVTA